MKKSVFAIGIILILTGVVMASYSNKIEENIQPSIVAYELKNWSVSANLEKDDHILVEIRLPTTWYNETAMFEPTEPGEGPPSGMVLYSTVDIIDPRGNRTRFMITWTPVISETTQVPITLTYYNITVLEQDGLDPTVLYRPESNAYDAVGGIIKESGRYNVTLGNIYPPRTDPPSYLGISKATKTLERPYTSFLPVGVAVGAAGSGFSLFGLKSQKGISVKKKKNGNS
jgi:hypothetical protein